MNLLVRNVIEREIKREKVQMKPPLAAAGRNINFLFFNVWNKLDIEKLTF
jgi:hypothetical protein